MLPREMTDHAACCRGGLSLITAAVLAALLLPTATASAASCPNQAIQEEQHAGYLPDCRGYELASPVNKNEEEVESPGVQGHQVPFDASAAGAGLVFGVLGALPGSLSGAYYQQYLA